MNDELWTAFESYHQGNSNIEDYDKIRIKNGMLPMSSYKKSLDGIDTEYTLKSIDQTIILKQHIHELEKMLPMAKANYNLNSTLSKKKFLKVFLAIVEVKCGLSQEAILKLEQELYLLNDRQHNLTTRGLMNFLLKSYKMIDPTEFKLSYNKLVQQSVDIVITDIKKELLQELEI